MNTSTKKIQYEHDSSYLDFLKTKKSHSENISNNAIFDILGLAFEKEVDPVSPFFETVRDLKTQKENGTRRLEKDLEFILGEFQNNAIQCPMSTQKIMQKNYSPTALQLILQNKDFLKSYEKLRTQFLKIINPQKSLFTLKKWNQVLESLDGIYLTISDRVQLAKTIYYLIKVELGVAFEKQEQDVHLLTQKYPLNEACFCEEAAYELTKLKTKIKDRKQHTRKVLAFMEDFTQFKMDFSQLSDSKEITKSNNDQDKKVDERAFELCKKDIYAFSFVTLYISNCVNTYLQKNSENVFEIINKLKSALEKLAEKYPPNPAPIVQTNPEEDEEVKLVIDDSYQKGNMYIPTIKLKKAFSIEDKINTIYEEIQKKSRIAKSNKERFDKEIRPICQKLGKNYQSGLKIRTNTSEDRLSKYRAFEKIVFKKKSKQLNKFQESFDNQKKILVQNFINSQHFNKFNKIYAFNTQCYEAFIGKKYFDALNGKDELPFNVPDLLRAKAVFQKQSDIIKTANKIYERFAQMQSGYYSLLQYENRLGRQTKDFQLNILVNGTITELQLALALDKSANEFNHKLYELKRSQDLTPLITLQAINEQLVSKFFINELQLCYYLVEEGKGSQNGNQNGNLKDSKSLKEFEKILANNVETYSAAKGTFDKLIFSQDRSNMQIVIEEMFKRATSYVEKGTYNEDKGLQYKRDQLRKSNNYLCFNEKKH